jgi:hypothetical protein
MKEQTIKGQLKIALNKLRTIDGYEEKVEAVAALAEQMLEVALTTKDERVKLDYIKEIADRTEGKPQQHTDITSKGQSVTPILGGMSVLSDDSDQEDSTPQEED